jgi:regulator of replication initiation timing
MARMKDYQTDLEDLKSEIVQLIEVNKYLQEENIKLKNELNLKIISEMETDEIINNLQQEVYRVTNKLLDITDPLKIYPRYIEN